MCLGVPGRVIAVDGMLAVVDFWGVRKQLRLDVVDQPVASRRFDVVLRESAAPHRGRVVRHAEVPREEGPRRSTGPFPVRFEDDRLLGGDEDVAAERGALLRALRGDCEVSRRASRAHHQGRGNEVERLGERLTAPWRLAEDF